MPVCPTCHTDYSSLPTVCEICNTSLSTGGDAPDENAGIELIELATFPSVAEAEMVKEIVEKNGIRTVQRGETDPIGIASGAEPVTLLVEERHLPMAREIYEAYFAGGEEPTAAGE